MKKYLVLFLSITFTLTFLSITVDLVLTGPKKDKLNVLKKEGDYFLMLEENYLIVKDGKINLVEKPSFENEELSKTKNDIANLEINIAWKIIFEDQPAYFYERVSYDFVWQFSLLPLRDQGEFKKVKLSYSPEKKKFIIKELGLIKDYKETEKALNIGVYINLFFSFLLILFLNLARRNSGTKEEELRKSPFLIYLRIFIFLFLLFVIREIVQSTTGVSLFFSLIIFFLVIVFIFFTSKKIYSQYGFLISLFYTVLLFTLIFLEELLNFYTDFEAFIQYCLILIATFFFLHFTIKTLVDVYLVLRARYRDKKIERIKQKKEVKKPSKN